MIQRWSKTIGILRISVDDDLYIFCKGLQAGTPRCQIIIYLKSYAGLIQRFSLGFRGPLCLVCGFTDVSASQFLAGVALGALGTLPIQLFFVSSTLYLQWLEYPLSSLCCSLKLNACISVTLTANMGEKLIGSSLKGTACIRATC